MISKIIRGSAEIPSLQKGSLAAASLSLVTELTDYNGDELCLLCSRAKFGCCLRASRIKGKCHTEKCHTALYLVIPHCSLFSKEQGT